MYFNSFPVAIFSQQFPYKTQTSLSFLSVVCAKNTYNISWNLIGQLRHFRVHLVGLNWTVYLITKIQTRHFWVCRCNYESNFLKKRVCNFILMKIRSTWHYGCPRCNNLFLPFTSPLYAFRLLELVIKDPQPGRVLLCSNLSFHLLNTQIVDNHVTSTRPYVWCCRAFFAIWTA